MKYTIKNTWGTHVEYSTYSTYQPFTEGIITYKCKQKKPQTNTVYDAYFYRLYRYRNGVLIELVNKRPNV